jgi:hypothetical protein
VDDLPHFLLLLLILQRFDDAKWGSFMECPQSGMKVVPGAKLSTVSFDVGGEAGQKTTILFFPDDREVGRRTTLFGHGTSVIGGRKGPPPTKFGNLGSLRAGNDLVVKIYWPEESGTSEVDILRKAKEYGEEIDFIGNHIPEIVYHQDPNFLCSSTGTIRRFVGLPTDGSRRLRVIVSRRLRLIKKLKVKDMLTAYLQCFFCKYNGHTSTSTHHSRIYDTGHFCLWTKGIQHGDVSPENLMWDDVREVGILSGFGLARFVDQTSARGQDNTRKLPFMALDLLSEEGLRGEIPLRYRHEAESFTWSLIYLHLSTVNRMGNNNAEDPYGYVRQSSNWESSRKARFELQWGNYDLPNIPLVHRNAKALARALHKYWLSRFERQFPQLSEENNPQGSPTGTFNVLVPTTANPRYEEPGDDRVFQELLAEHEEALDIPPLKEIRDDLMRMELEYKEIDWAT